MAEAFYVADGDRFLPQAWTRGPWGPDAQHAGPPAALVGRAVERLGPVGGMRVARFTMEVLRPIPIRPLRVEAEVVRPGRRVAYARAALADDEGTVALAGAWLIRPSEDLVPEVGREAPGTRPSWSPPADAGPSGGRGSGSPARSTESRGSIFGVTRCGLGDVALIKCLGY